MTSTIVAYGAGILTLANTVILTWMVFINLKIQHERNVLDLYARRMNGPKR